MAEPIDDGIADGRDLILDDSTVSGNTAQGSGGGAFIQLDGRMESARVVFDQNSSGADGGGMRLATTDAGIEVATFSENSATRGGGLSAASQAGGGDIRLFQATFSDNSATDHGGGLTADDLDQLTLTNSTVSGNSAAEGGGISVGVDPMDDPELVTARATTITANTAPVGANVVTYEGTLRTEAALIVGGLGGPGCSVGAGNLDPVGFTFTDDPACAGAGSDMVSADDPQLGPLTANGGPTETHLPAATSPIGGLVPAASCTAAADQRDVVRPQGTGCEPGSVEVAETAVGPEVNDITGTGGKDILLGTAGRDRILGLGGADLLVGLGADDEVDGGSGNDLIIGGPGVDQLSGGAGNDLLIGDEDDVLVGGPGLDICIQIGRPMRLC